GPGTCPPVTSPPSTRPSASAATTSPSPSAAPAPLRSPLFPCDRALEQVLLGRCHQPRTQGTPWKHCLGTAAPSTGSSTQWSPLPSMAVSEHRAQIGRAHV